MDLALITTSALVISLLWLIYSRWARWPLNLVGLFCLAFLWFYGIRMVSTAVGLDTLFPDYLFGPDLRPATKANLLLAIFLGAVIAGLVLAQYLPRALWFTFPVVRSAPHLGRVRTVATALTVFSMAMLLFFLGRHGSFSGMITAAKLDKELAGTFFLHIVPDMGAVVSVTWFLEVIRRSAAQGRRGPTGEAAVALVFAFINGLVVMAWGSRTLLALVSFGVLAGWLVFRPSRRSSSAASRNVLTFRLAAVGVVLVALIVGLRVARDHATTGETSPGIANQTLVRQVAVGGNMTQYDALVLASRDWPSTFDFRDGEDFRIGFLGVIPRAIWEDKPATIAPGSWFRQVYEPERKNGWPPGTPGEWFLNFGTAGIAIGGVISGVLLLLAKRALGDVRRQTYAFVATAAIGLQVLLVGYQAQFPIRYVQWCLPLIFVGWLLRTSPTYGASPVPTTSDQETTSRTGAAGS